MRILASGFPISISFPIYSCILTGKKKAPFKLAFSFLFICYSFFYSLSIHLKALLQIFYVASFPEISPLQHRGDYFRLPSHCGTALWCLEILSLSSELLIPVAVVCMNSWYL